jgi:phospholipase A1
MRLRSALGLVAGLVWLAGAQAQNQPAHAAPAAVDAPAWQHCARLSADPAARLACFDHWAQQQALPPAPAAPPAANASVAAPMPEAVPAQQATAAAPQPDCRSGPQSALSRFWELEAGSDCGRFNLRNYRPVSLSLIASDSVNMAPSSPTPGHSADYQPYLQTEGRIQLSVRTKIGQGFLTHDDPVKRDSLWFGYTQQSYWQIFTSSISRPFRNTDHEPEFMYIVPTDAALPGGWRLRYSGLSINHQSNGQSLPLSRSWNRAILMAGMEKDTRFTLSGRLWQRLGDGDETDDNPGISDHVGRAELTGQWNLDRDNTLGLTVRHSLTHAANGSVRLEWLRALGNGHRGSYASGLRFHTQLFSGYGDSLVDYNRWRTVLSIGLSLVDW